MPNVTETSGLSPYKLTGPFELTSKLSVKRIRTLKRIFDFYSKQKMLVGEKPTFDDIKKRTNDLFIGEFNKMMKDFKVTESMTKRKEPQYKVLIQQSFKLASDNLN